MEEYWKSVINFGCLLIAFFILVCFISFTSADSVNITNQTGETWIQWEWDVIANYDIWVDGTEMINDRTYPNYLLINDLNSNEPHDIQLRDPSTHTLIQSQITYTTESSDIVDETLTEFFLSPVGLLLIWILLVIVSLIAPIFFIPAIILSIYNLSLVVNNTLYDPLFILLFGMCIPVTIFVGFVRMRSK